MSDIDIGLSKRRFQQIMARQNEKFVRHRFENNKTTFLIRSSFINTLANCYESLPDLVIRLMCITPSHSLMVTFLFLWRDDALD